MFLNRPSRKLSGCRLLWIAFSAIAAALWAGASAEAQQPPVHYYHLGSMPPGAIGTMQLGRGGPVRGFFQPVRIKAPPGTAVALAVAGQFQPPQQTPVVAGFLVGQVYRLRVTGIPLHPGEEVFPTLEVIDRLYTPTGHQWQFPIEIELTLEDLELALSGKFVTRVVYLEDPRLAQPVAQQEHQSWVEVAPGHDPLAMADQLGRPVAIVRLGARTPTGDSMPDMDFLYGCPPFVPSPLPQADTIAPAGRQASAQPAGFRPEQYTVYRSWNGRVLSAMANPPVPDTIIR